MREHTSLRWNLQSPNNLVEQLQQPADHNRIVACGINADAGVAGSQHDAVEDRGGDALGVIKGMTRLQPPAHSSTQSDGVANSGNYLEFLGDQDQVLIAHQ